MPTLAIHLDNKKDKSGRSTLYLRYTNEGKPQYISLGKKIEPQYFEPGNGLFVKRNAPNATHLNFLLSGELSRGRDILYDFERQEIIPSFKEFRQRFKNDGRTKFHAYAMERLTNKFHGRKKNGTYHNYKRIYDSFKRFAGDISIGQINKSVLNNYRKFLIDTTSNQTANHYLGRIKGVYFAAEKEGHKINKRIFDEIDTNKLPPIGKKESLTFEEIEIIEKFWKENFGLKDKSYKSEMIRAFLFMIYAGGLRFSEAKSLKYTNLFWSHDYLFIDHLPTKVKTPLLHPLVKKSFKYIELDKVGKDEFVFNLKEPDIMNKHIQFFSQKLGIKKHLSSHCARHTYINLSYELGMPEHILLQFTKNPTALRKYYSKIKPKTLIAHLESTWEMKKKPTYGFHTKSKHQKLRTNMRKLREKRNLSQEALGNKIAQNGIAGSQISRYESGDQVPDILYLLDFCRKMEVTLQQLMNGEF